MVMVPDVGSIRRHSRRAVVLLPHPVSPTMPRVSPSLTSKETPSTAFTAPIWRWKITPRLIGKCLVRSRTSTRLVIALGVLRSGDDVARVLVALQPMVDRVDG